VNQSVAAALYLLLYQSELVLHLTEFHQMWAPLSHPLKGYPGLQNLLPPVQNLRME